MKTTTSYEQEINQYLEAVRGNLSGLSTEEVDGILADLREHIDKSLQASGGEPTKERVASVLAEMDPPESFAADYEGEAQPAKVSRLAVLGAVLLPFGIAAALLFFPVSLSTSGSTAAQTAWWQWLLRFTVIPLGIAAPFATTILGMVSLAQIRASKGRLVGRGLALLDALFYPLLALDGLLLALMFWFIASLPEGQLMLSEGLTILSILLVVVVDVVIAAIAWAKLK